MLQLTVFTRNFISKLCNKHAIVCKGTGYPNNNNPMGMLFSGCVGALNVETHKNTYPAYSLVSYITSNHHRAVMAVKGLIKLQGQFINRVIYKLMSWFAKSS